MSFWALFESRDTSYVRLGLKAAQGKQASGLHVEGIKR